MVELGLAKHYGVRRLGPELRLEIMPNLDVSRIQYPIYTSLPSRQSISPRRKTTSDPSGICCMADWKFIFG